MKQKIKMLIQNFIDNTTNIATLNSRSLFVRENLETITELTSYLPENSKINERLYIIFHDLYEKDLKCPMCDKKRKFYTFTSGYNLCCSQSCVNKYQQTYLITKEQKEIIYKQRTENNRNVNVKILDKHYTIPYQLAVRLKNMKSQKSKEKLQKTIMENYKPIISI